MTDNKNNWRLIPLLEANGEMQMAIDRWLLSQHLLGKLPSILRFYTWSNATISLGYHQRHFPEHWSQLIWQGKKLDIVRRPTGGRAVLHQGDLTYAVVTSGLSNIRIEAYKNICKFLIQGWKSLGVDLDYGTAGRGYIHNPNCFGTATGADLVTPEGAKLIGSAQLRKDGAILQHGSMPLNQDSQLYAQIFGAEFFPNAKLPSNLTIESITKSLITAASDCFNVVLELQPLSTEELEEVQQSSMKAEKILFREMLT